MTEKEYKAKLTQAHTEGYNRGYAKAKQELDRLRKFEKKVRKLQDKCNRYGEKASDYYTSNPKKSVEYEMKYDEALEEFLCL